MADFEKIINSRIEKNEQQAELDVIRMKSVCELYIKGECSPETLHGEMVKYFKMYSMYMIRMKECEHIMTIKENIGDDVNE